MNCDRIKDMMIEYLYGELSRDQAEAFQAHLEECPACADEVTLLAQFRKLASDAPDPEPSALTMQRIVATAREEAEAPKSIWSFRWFRVLATVCVMAIVGGVVTYQVKTGIVTPTKVASPPAEETPALPPSGEMVATGPKVATPAETAKPETPSVPADTESAAKVDVAPEPKPTNVVNGSTSPDEPVVAEAKTKPGTAPRETESGETLYVIDRASGEPIPVDSEGRQLRTRSSDHNYLTGSTSESRPEPSAETAAPKPLAKKSMDGAGGGRDVKPPTNGGSGKVAKQLQEAQTALDTGQYGQAIQALTHLLKVLPVGHPDRARALMWLAKAYEGQGMKDLAVEVWDMLAGESPSHAEMAHRRIEALTQR